MDRTCTSLANSYWVDCVFDFQTLITGLLAVCAALWAARYAQRQVNAANDQIKVGRDQIAAAKEQADRDRAGRLRAARASLPTALSLVCEFAVLAGRAVRSSWPRGAETYPKDHDPGQSHLFELTALMPPFPGEVLATLERVVEFTTVDAVADRIESLLREIHAFSARTRPLARGFETTLDWSGERIIQAGAIYARAASLVPYGLHQVDHLDKDSLWDRLEEYLTEINLSYGFVAAEARRQRKSGSPPGDGDTINMFYPLQIQGTV
jgi:hypothetical protein